jgi:hypothetical protein
LIGHYFFLAGIFGSEDTFFHCHFSFYIMNVYYYNLFKNSIIEKTHVTDGSHMSSTNIRPGRPESPAMSKETQVPPSQGQDSDPKIGGVTLFRPRNAMKKKYYQRALDKAQIIGAIGTLKLCKVKLFFIGCKKLHYLF